MKKRLYFECPIQALYMMKEFGIELQIFERQWLASKPGYGEKLISFNKFWTNEMDGSNDNEVRPVSLVSADFGKIYVAKESEAIFSSKPDDRDLEGYTYDFQTGVWFLGHEPKQHSEIAFRDNKHFFQPKIEGAKDE